MIVDSLKNAYLYKGLNSGIDKILEEAAKLSADNFKTGRLVIDGDDLFINHVTYETKSRKASSCEAHRLYIDVMYMVEGNETIYVKPTEKLKTIKKEYSPRN